MSYQPTEQVKRLQTLLATLEEKTAAVTRLEQDTNSQLLAIDRAQKDLRLALEKSKKDLDQVRGQVAVEIEKLDPALKALIATRPQGKMAG